VVITLLVVGSPGRRAKDPERQPAPMHQGSQGTEGATAEGARAPFIEEPVFEVVDGEWRMPAYRLAMRLPEGWEPVERRGRPYAYLDREDPLRGSFNVLSLPNFRGLDFEALREENRRTIEGSPDLDLLALVEIDVSGHRAVRIDYVGRPNGGEEMRFAGIVMLSGGKQIVVTAATRVGEWDALEPEIAASLSSLVRLTD
jgi:hypothetical protein